MLDQVTYNPSRTASAPPVFWLDPGGVSQSDTGPILQAVDIRFTNDPLTGTIAGGYVLTKIDFPPYALFRSIPLSIERLNGSYYVVSDSILNLYGIGNTVAEAIDEFTSMLVDLFDELRNSENILSSNLRQQLDYLKTIITIH